MIERSASEPDFEAERDRAPGPGQINAHGSSMTLLMLLLLAALLGFYLWMFLRYRPYDIDNPWFLSFSYNTFVEHVRTDQFMNVPFPSGMDGTHLFGLLGAAPQYAVASIAGWQQQPIAILSAACVTLSLMLWVLQLKKLGYGNRFLLSFVLIAGLSEPFLSTAEKFRYEAISLLLISAGLLLIAHRRVFSGMFLAAVAFEVEPMAILGLIPALVLTYLLWGKTRQLLLRAAAGVALAGAFCLYLHPEILHFPQLIKRAGPMSGATGGGIFRAYFVTRLRHLPELAIFFVAGMQYWRRRKQIRSHYLGLSAAAGALISAVVPHGNVAYMVFIYPLLVGMALVAFEAELRAGWIVALGMMYLLPQYAWLVYLNRDLGYRGDDIRKVTLAIDEASRKIGVSDAKLRIYGDYGLWFAHPHFYRAASLDTLPYVNQADLYICYAHPPFGGPLAAQDMLYCPDLTKELSLRLVYTTDVRGNALYLYAKQDR